MLIYCNFPQLLPLGSTPQPLTAEVPRPRRVGAHKVGSFRPSFQHPLDPKKTHAFASHQMLGVCAAVWLPSVLALPLQGPQEPPPSQPSMGEQITVPRSPPTEALAQCCRIAKFLQLGHHSGGNKTQAPTVSKASAPGACWGRRWESWKTPRPPTLPPQFDDSYRLSSISSHLCLESLLMEKP